MVTLNQQSLKQWQDDDMESLRYGYRLLPDDIVLDIGSYRREWGSEIEKRYGCKIEYFDALDNKAAWMYNGKLAFGGDYLYTSIHADKIDKEYWCVDIAEYLHRSIALMKINIEGGEYELLNYIYGKGLMNNIRDLQVQFHLISGEDCEKMYNDLATRLSETHQLTWRYPFCWENWQLKTEYNKRFHSA